jgi:hypothetical protein
MGDRKPSQFLKHLRSLVPDQPDQPASRESIGHSCLPSRGRAG